MAGAQGARCIVTTGESMTGVNWRVRQSDRVVQRVAALIEPLLAAEGFALIDLEYQLGGRATLRVFADRAGRSAVAAQIDPSGAITIEQLSSLSRLISDAIDVDDPIEGRYHLEVSSPGLERPLARREDFASAIGHEVSVKTVERIGDRQKFRGVLTGVDDSGIVVSVDGQAATIPAAAIAKAFLTYPPAPADPAPSRRARSA